MELKRITKNTVTTREEHWCHLRNAKKIGVPQINSRWSTFPLDWIHSHLAFHIIYNKWLDILYYNPEIPWDTHLKCIGTSISVKQQDERSGHPISSGDESWFPVFDCKLSHFSTSTSRGVFPLEYVCERDPVFYASSEMDPEMPCTK